MKTTTITKSAIALTAGALLAVGLPLAANAHVTINPNAAEAGGYTVITVKVPNESATAATNKVELSLPMDTPFTSVRYVPVAGWTGELITETLPEPVTVGDTEITEAITKVVWTADAGAEIADGQLQQFDVSVGPVPDVGSLVLGADQFYTDGSVVSWSDEAADAQYPAPVLYVNDSPESDHHAAGGHDDEADSEDTATANATDSSSAAASDDTLARGLGLGGLILGAIAVVLAITGRRKSTN
jgi:uncharacterized protein YcnI